MQTSLRPFLSDLLKTFDQSIMDYKKYLAEGKKFQYAQELKKNNSTALQLLQNNKELLPEELRADADALIIHYTIWTNKWEELAHELNPAPDDLFVFPNTITFPRSSAIRLEELFASLGADN